MKDGHWLNEPLVQSIPIRKMTEEGIAAFYEYLKALKSGGTNPLPDELLLNERFARVIDISITVEPGTFETSLEMAKYLHPRIQSLSLPGKFYDAGLWAWLTAFYFDSICHADSLGRRRVGEIARYIPPISRASSYRHLMALAVRMFDVHGEKRMKLFLYTSPAEMSSYMRVVAGTEELAANAGLLDALNILYWDEEKQRPKRAARDMPGGLFRFMAVMNQFNRTYDLLAMSGKQIINLLPKDEFGRWLKHRKPS